MVYTLQGMRIATSKSSRLVDRARLFTTLSRKFRASPLAKHCLVVATAYEFH